LLRGINDNTVSFGESQQDNVNSLPVSQLWASYVNITWVTCMRRLFVAPGITKYRSDDSFK